jgi:phenylacetate-CoA ligase
MNRVSRMLEATRALRAAAKARERERWRYERMRAHHADALDQLARHAIAHSPFYGRHLGGVIGGAPVELAALPPLNRATLMANLDDALCAAELRERDLRSHLLDEDPIGGEYRVMASSGSTGTPGLYVYSRTDWIGVLALFFRYSELCGIRPHLPRLRVAGIGAPSLASMTQRGAQSIDVGLHRVLRLSAGQPLSQLVDALNAFRPDALNVYPSIAAALAAEQLTGRLRIAPKIISTSSELCTPEMSERIKAAFGVQPFNFYATTEGLWGVDCEHHEGIHLFEDWCIVENVDDAGRPVPDGEPGTRLLVTNLFNCTLPLIRFEISDSVTIDRRPCACGRTLPRMRAVQGRLEEVIYLPGTNGHPVTVHPTQFATLAVDANIREFQVVQRGNKLVLRLALHDSALQQTTDRAVHAITVRLHALGVHQPAITSEIVPALARTPAGKLKLIVHESEPESGEAAVTNSPSLTSLDQRRATQ